MAFYGYPGDADKGYWTPYTSNFDYDFARTPTEASAYYSSPYEFGESEYNSPAYYHSFATQNYWPETLQYEPFEYHHSSQSYHDCWVNAYPSELTYSQPKLFQYEPPPEFQFSYSVVEFNESEFEEYNPAPYGGGYDPVTTYGEPLPPSDSICYPRSVPRSDDSTSLENFSYGSIPSPYGKEDDLPLKPQNGRKPIDTIDKVTPEAEIVDKVTPEAEIVESSDVIPTDDYSPNGFQNGNRGDYENESERHVPQIPYGSGLETVDLCESIFGYWPCLAKIEQQEQQRAKCSELYDQDRRMEPLKSAVDYLFGSPSAVYDYENYRYQQQQQHPPLYQSYENSWLQ